MKIILFAIRAKLGLTPKWMLDRTPMNIVTSGPCVFLAEVECGVDLIITTIMWGGLGFRVMGYG